VENAVGTFLRIHAEIMEGMTVAQKAAYEVKFVWKTWGKEEKKQPFTLIQVLL
jgi:hypothetical protein